MSIELKQAAQQVLDAFEAFGEADDFATLFTLTQKMNALRAAIQQAESDHARLPGVLKDHQIAAMVNSLRDIARQFHGHDSLRERIANVLVPALKAEAKTDVRCEGCGYMTHHREHMGCVRAAKQFTHPAPVVPEFSRIAKRKLDELREQGFAITGYAIQRGPVRGFIDGAGFVGWWQCEPDPGVPDDVARDAERWRTFLATRPSNTHEGIIAAIDAASPAQKGGE